MCSGWLQGPPFEFKFVSTLRLPTEAQAHAKVEVREAMDGHSSDEATRPTPETRLHGTFNTQWCDIWPVH